MIKKEKIFELKIQDDDELSGIDSISLVDEPAIEVNWVAFKKEKEHEFHIPDGEDNIYIEKLMSVSQDEQELFDEGWVVEKVTVLGEQGFYSTDPNGPSIEDTKEYNVRYKYILKPGIAESSVIKTTRDFCKTLVSQNRVWRIEDMEATRNDFGDSALVWRGGYNCRHVWARIEYKKDAVIINKASINKGKIDPQAPVDTRVLGIEQPSTVTTNTLANPSPSTVRNLGLSKVYNFVAEKVSIDYDDTLSTDRGKELAKKLLEEGKDVSVITRRQADQLDEVYKTAEELGIPRDKVHATNGKLKWETIKKLGIERHIDNNENEIKAIQENIPDVTAEKFDYNVGTIGGYVDPGVKKKKPVIEKGLTKPSMFESYNDYPESARNNACKVLRWRDEHGDEVDGMTQVGWTRANQLCNGENISEETISRMASFARHRQNAEVSPEFKSTPWKDKGYVAWLGWGGTTGIEWAQNKLESIRNKMSKQKFQTDEEKKIVIGPAMIPDIKIFRKDALGNPYYVFFSPETIKMIAEKYMRNKYTDNNDQMHNGKAIRDVYVFESWIKESENDKSTDYGYGDLPIGTWFVSMKVNNPVIWEKVKTGQLNGFSVSGFFEEVASFCREEMFLQQVAKILSEVKD